MNKTIYECNTSRELTWLDRDRDVFNEVSSERKSMLFGLLNIKQSLTVTNNIQYKKEADRKPIGLRSNK